MTARDVPIVGLGFTSEFSPWAGDFVDDYDWPAIRSDYNARLMALAPKGVCWGWSEAGPWCVADMTLDADEVRQAWVEAVGGGDWDPFIDFESIAARHETGAVVDLHETDAVCILARGARAYVIPTNAVGNYASDALADARAWLNGEWDPMDSQLEPTRLDGNERHVATIARNSAAVHADPGWLASDYLWGQED